MTDLFAALRNEVQSIKRLEQVDDSYMINLLEEAADEIERLEAALRRINAINDHPGRFSKEIQDVLDAVIDTSDVKFT